MVLYVREIPQGGGWQNVLAADTKNPAQPVIYLARSGRMLVDRQARTIQMVLQDGARHTTKLDDPAAYEVLKFQQMVVSLDPESVFPRTGPGARGPRAVGRRAAAARQGARSRRSVHPQPDHGDPQEILHSGGVLRVRPARPRARREQSQGRQARQLRPRHRRHLRLLRRDVLGPGDDQGLHHSGVALDVAAQHRPRHRRRRAADLARALRRPADSHPASPLRAPLAGFASASVRRAARSGGRGAIAAGHGTVQGRPRRPRHPDSPVRASPPEPAGRLRRAPVPADPGHDDHRHARAVLHLDLPRPLGQVVQRADHASVKSSRSCGGRRRSSWPTSLPWPCCCRRW